MGCRICTAVPFVREPPTRRRARDPGSPRRRPPEPHLLPMTASIGRGVSPSAAWNWWRWQAVRHAPVHLRRRALRVRCREAVAAWGDGVAYLKVARLWPCWPTRRACVSDVATGGELHVALSVGVPPSASSCTQQQSEASCRALEVGVAASLVDSFDEIDPPRPTDRCRLGSSGPSVPGARSGDPGSRCTPTSSCARAGGFEVRVLVASGAASKAVAALELAPPGVELVAVHAHIGSQVFERRPFRRGSGHPAEFSPRSRLRAGVGGGLGVAYVNGEQTPTQGEWARPPVTPASRPVWRRAPGSRPSPAASIVATAGITLYRGRSKNSRHSHYVGRRGMSDNRARCSTERLRSLLAREPAARRPRAVRVVGKHCESGDVIDAEAGWPDDLVGATSWPPGHRGLRLFVASNYNKVPRPRCSSFRGGQARLVVRGETSRLGPPDV